MIFALALATWASSAAAEWTVFERDADSTTYVDRSRIKRSGDMVKVWFVFNYNKPSSMTGHSSVVSLFEYDCKDGRERLLKGTAHKGQMGDGAVIFTSDRAEPWTYIAPNNYRESRLTRA